MAIAQKEKFLNFEPQNCVLLEDMTPMRALKEKSYLCECKLCGKRFIRSRKYLKSGYTDCGCMTGSETAVLKETEHNIHKLDRLSKEILKAKLAVLGDEKLVSVFDALYIKRMSASEYTAVSLYISMSTLRRKRLKICALWHALKNEIMQKQIGV